MSTVEVLPKFMISHSSISLDLLVENCNGNVRFFVVVCDTLVAVIAIRDSRWNYGFANVDGTGTALLIYMDLFIMTAFIFNPERF